MLKNIFEERIENVCDGHRYHLTSIELCYSFYLADISLQHFLHTALDIYLLY